MTNSNATLTAWEGPSEVNPSTSPDNASADGHASRRPIAFEATKHTWGTALYTETLDSTQTRLAQAFRDLRDASSKAERVDTKEDGYFSTWPLIDTLKSEAVTLMWCSHQVGGHGRDGRRWEPLPAPQIYASVLLTYNFSTQALSQLPALSLVVGLSLLGPLTSWRAQSQSARSPKLPLQLKWPNDLFLDDRKFGGIIIDTLAQEGQRVTLLIGFGLNVGGKSLPASLEKLATTLDTQELPYDVRAKLLDQMIVSLLAHTQDFARSGFAPFVERYRACHALSGRRVLVDVARANGAPPLCGTVIDIHPSGSLLIRDDQGLTHQLYSGHVQLERS